jgi:hypothetical protein
MSCKRGGELLCCSYCLKGVQCLPCSGVKDTEPHWACEECAQKDPATLVLLTDAEVDAAEELSRAEEDMRLVSLVEPMEREQFNGRWGFYFTTEGGGDVKMFIPDKRIPPDFQYLLDDVDNVDSLAEVRNAKRSHNTGRPPIEWELPANFSDAQCRSVLTTVMQQTMDQVSSRALFFFAWQFLPRSYVPHRQVTDRLASWLQPKTMARSKRQKLAVSTTAPALVPLMSAALSQHGCDVVDIAGSGSLKISVATMDDVHTSGLLPLSRDFGKPHSSGPCPSCVPASTAASPHTPPHPTHTLDLFGAPGHLCLAAIRCFALRHIFSVTDLLTPCHLSQTPSLRRSTLFAPSACAATDIAVPSSNSTNLALSNSEKLLVLNGTPDADGNIIVRPPLLPSRARTRTHT